MDIINTTFSWTI